AAMARSVAASKPAAIKSAASASSPRRDNPYMRPFGRLSVEELEQQILDTELAIGECQAAFGDPDSFKDPQRGKTLQTEYETLAEKLKQLEQEYFAREH